MSGDSQLAGSADAVVPKPYDWNELIAIAHVLLKEGGTG